MSSRAARHGLLAALLLFGGALLFPEASTPKDVPIAPVAAHDEPALEQPKGESDKALGCSERPLRTPSGGPPRLSCEAARDILAEMHSRYAGPTDEPSSRAFSNTVTGWFDPHGLWSAAPDSPVSRALARYGAQLLAEVRMAPHSLEPCRAAMLVGTELKGWVAELSNIYERATHTGSPLSRPRAFNLFAEAVFQDDPVTQPARVLARRLGERAGHFAATNAGATEQLLRAAKARYFPDLSAQAWGEAVLAAAVRAYVPLLDPHGAWAPFDEEWSLYAEDPGFDGSPRLWGEVTRTAVAVRVLSDALPPLENGDLVLSVDGVPTAGMPLEQIEQLGRVEPESSERKVLAWNVRDAQPRELLVNVTEPLDPGEQPFSLQGERVRFGGGFVLVVRIPDVPEGLGESLGRVIADARDPSLLGVVLDLRGNGGGSTEAAAGALGLFLPGAPLFPLSKRGRQVEIMRAPRPDPEQRWSGPVAAIVDGYTASAAEMIAGALSAYGRGVLLGGRTFGKGCIQEYADDRTGHGVLRVTTLLYALPDGSAVQRTGLVPDVLLPVGKAQEREADVGGSLPGHSGQDVRDQSIARGPAWPAHRGDLGHAPDAVILSALRRLGAPASTPRVRSARRSSLRASTSATARP